MAGKNIGASIGYGILLFIILTIGFIMLTTAVKPPIKQPQAGDISGLMSNIIAFVLISATALMLIVFGPLEGLIVGAILGVRHRGEPVRGLVSSLVASLLGYVIMIVVLVVWIASMLPPMPAEQTGLQTGQSMLQERWRIVLALAATAFTGAVTGLIVSFATGEGKVREGESS